MALKDAFVNMAKNAAAGAASSFVSGVAGNLRSGLGGSSSSSASSPLQTGYNKPQSILLYPSDVGTNMHQASYILFTGYSISKAKVKPMKKGVKVKPVMKVVGAGIGATQEVDEAATERAQNAAFAKDNADSTGGSSLLLSRRNIPKSGTVIGLYMPPSVNVSYSMDYQDAPIGAMSEALYGIIKDMQGGKNFFDAIGSSAGTIGSGLKQMGAKTIDAILPGAKDLIAIERGVITAPRTELMFQGIGRREFSFTFTFIPKDHTESKTVRDIVQKFKEGMTPHFNQASTTREMTIPDVFQIDYMHINQKNYYLNKIGKCYLTKLDVTYGGDKFVTYNTDVFGGAPPQKTVIALTFKELEIMDRDKVEQGY